MGTICFTFGLMTAKFCFTFFLFTKGTLQQFVNTELRKSLYSRDLALGLWKLSVMREGTPKVKDVTLHFIGLKGMVN